MALTYENDESIVAEGTSNYLYVESSTEKSQEVNLKAYLLQKFKTTMKGMQNILENQIKTKGTIHPYADIKITNPRGRKRNHFLGS